MVIQTAFGPLVSTMNRACISRLEMFAIFPCSTNVLLFLFLGLRFLTFLGLPFL